MDRLDGWIMVSVSFVVVEQIKMGLIPMEVFMLPAANHERVRLSISVPIETKNKLCQLTHFQGKRISDFIRETIEEKLSQMDRQNFEAQMKAAYQGLADEHIQITDDFKYADSENLS